MCLAIPAKVIQIEGNTATVELSEMTTQADISLLEGVKTGDYLIIHTGMAIEVLNETEAQETLKILSELAQTLPQEER